MKGEFCRFVTRDGLELHGFWSAAGVRPKTALVHVHGWDGNFYENRFIEHACRAALANGMSFFTFNNRGHDYVADLLRPKKNDYVQLGGIYETMADSELDIEAAIGFCLGRGAKRIILQGHSHGAVKAALYASSRQDRSVVGLVLLSPSDDLGMIRARLERRYPAALRIARRLMASRHGRTLMPGWVLEYPVSAQTFLDCFGPGSVTAMFNVSRTDRREFPELGRITAPVLLAVGTEQEAFVGNARQFVEGVGLQLDNAASFVGCVIEGAPHNYLGHEVNLGRILKRWLRRQTPAKAEARSHNAEGRSRGRGR